jgi:hypothetical protein
VKDGPSKDTSICENCEKKLDADKKNGILSPEEMNKIAAINNLKAQMAAKGGVNQYQLLDQLNQLYNSLKNKDSFNAAASANNEAAAAKGEAGPDFTHQIALQGPGSLLGKS